MIDIQSISHSFDQEQVLRNVSVQLAPNQTLAILGKSGCGKTTFLKILAGALVPDGGQFHWQGTDMLQLPAQDRGVVYLSQEPLLFPHMTVAENVGFGLAIRKRPKPEINRRVADMLESLALKEHAEKRPDQLSGGQRQRVAFGRALVINPKVLLLDEPFASLDSQTRGDMQRFFRKVAAQFEITSMFVTHDLKEALILGDRLARMEAGALTTYPDRKAFMEDPRNGVQEELNFWQHIQPSTHGVQDL
ncbi:ABC transporter ATP-binding protein [Pontibacter sp. G13]|uniref:ABC transporter ATP-binding protein n=1 Tax=Pontibacter sp. G13 TaxID=3074898 RepID=UPI0028896EA1|nr:ABC transporter ATP-binding protein [Pontibacter sp. G13]WNJ20015.1 ABC transporter ATP-binding protein [Pontibacter sp. G13]